MNRLCCYGFLVSLENKILLMGQTVEQGMGLYWQRKVIYRGNPQLKCWEN